MRIDDTDPDELDEKIESRRRRRVIFAVAAVVAPLLAIGGFVVANVTEDDEADEAALETIAETVAIETVAEDPEVPFKPQGPNEFPDLGSDYMGEKLPLLTKRTNDAGITMTVQKLDWGAFGGGVFMGDGPIPVPMPEPGIVEGTAPATTVVIGSASAPPTNVVESADGPSRANADVSPIEPPANEPPAPTEPPFTAAPATTGPASTAPANGGGAVAGWEPAGWCTPSSGFRLTMTHGDSVGTSQGQMYDEVRNDMNATLFSGGHAEAKPFRVLVLQVSEAVTAASVQFAGAGGDAAAAENGFVVLGVVGNGVARFTVTLQIDGVERAIESTDIGTEGDLEWQEACTPPPPGLPAPGSQPDDPVAAEQQVRDVFTLQFDRSIPREDKVGLLDDDTGVAEALDELDAGGFGTVAQTAQYTMAELVFTSPTEAWFEYSIETTSGPFTGRFGIARLIDGRWRILRAVLCQDLQLAGVQCNPPVAPIQPPAAAGFSQD